MQRNPLIIAYHTALLFYASIIDISAFVICLSIMVELAIYTLIVAGFSLKRLDDFNHSVLFIFLTLSTLLLQAIVFSLIAFDAGEDPLLIFELTILPVSVGLVATHSLTVYRAIKEKTKIEDLRSRLGDQYMVIYVFGSVAPIFLAAISISYSFAAMICLAAVRILVEYNFFRPPILEPEKKKGIRGFIQLSPSQQANRLLRQIRREKRRKNSH